MHETCFSFRHVRFISDLMLHTETLLTSILNKFPEHLFNLKFASKDLERNAKKSEKGEREEKSKLKKVRFNQITKYFLEYNYSWIN